MTTKTKTNVSSEEECDKDLDELMTLEDSLRNKIKTKETHKGIISDINMGQKTVEFEIYIPDRDEYKYASYRLNRGDRIEKLLNSLDCSLHNITSVINSEVLLYSNLSSTNWYIVYSQNNLKEYLKDSDYYELNVPPFNESKTMIKQKNLLPQIYISIITILIVGLITNLGLGLVMAALFSGVFTFTYSVFLEYRYDINISKLRSESRV